MTHRVVLVGATGAFGARLAERLSHWPDIALVLAARRPGPLQALADTLGGAEVAVFDRERPGDLAVLNPWAVVDAAGPFQASDMRLAEAAIANGAHYVDLADGRDFVARFPAALNASAEAAGVVAVTGASSTPALSHAALDALIDGWGGVERVTVAISPGARAPRGLSVVQAILSYVGRPVRLFAAGRWTARAGWSGPRRLRFPGLGRRWVSLCETPDLDLLPQRFAPRRDALFLAGLELPILHLGLWLLSWSVRLGLVRDLRPLARVLATVAGLAEPFGSDRGGMVVLAEGEGRDGGRRLARWSLVADVNAGPTVPVAAAAAVLRALKEDRLGRHGAVACVGLVTLPDILAELDGLPIRTRTEVFRPDETALFPLVLGEAFAALPPAVRAVHGGASGTLRGRGRARGSRSLPIRIARGVLGLPPPGPHPELVVDIAVEPGGETWRRRFGRTRFASRLSPGRDAGVFEERFGPITFAFEADPGATGFQWRFIGWRLGIVPLPTGLAPRIRARAFARDGAYRFSVATAHPWLGLIFAYAGRLEATVG